MVEEKAAAMSEQKERVKSWAEGLASATGLELEVRVVRDEPEALTLSFDGTDAEQFSGRRGEVLDALQLLASFSLKGRSFPRLHILFERLPKFFHSNPQTTQHCICLI